MRRDSSHPVATPSSGGQVAGLDHPPTAELDLLTRDLGRKLDAEVVVLAGSSNGRTAPDLISAWGGGRVPEERLALPGRGGLVGRVLEDGRAVVSPLDPSLDRVLLRLAGCELRHAVAVPVGTPEHRIGALCAGFSGTSPGGPTMTLWVMESYARLMAFSLHQPGALEELLFAAHQDHLTGCLNYSSVRAELVTEIKRSERHRLALSCCFLDLVGFKAINERFGHLYGNEVLAKLGKSLRANVRSFDTVGRYGGDEFVVILPDTSQEKATRLAERLLGCVRATLLPSGERLDASIGVAEWLSGCSAEDTIASADRALRASKQDGAGIVAAGEQRGLSEPAA
jgi:diguanylate cyclase (GGDEF)-like protein